MGERKEIVLFTITQEYLPKIVDTLCSIKRDLQCFFIIYIDDIESFDGVDIPREYLKDRSFSLGASGMLLEEKEIYIVHKKLNIFMEDVPFLTEMTEDIFFNSLFKNQIFASIFLFHDIEEELLYSLKKIGHFSSDLYLEESIYQHYEGIEEFQTLPLFDGTFALDTLSTKIERLFAKEPLEISKEYLERVLSILQEKSFLDLCFYSDEKLRKNLSHRLKVTSLSLEEYLVSLESSHEWQLFHKEIFNSGSDFFANRERQEELKDLLRNITDAKFNESIRIWVAGAGTGEEAFYIAAALEELMLEEGMSFKVQIFATDISEEALSFGFMPLFTQSELLSLDINLVERSFKKEGNKYKLSQEIRDKIIFTEHNLVKDVPLTNIDMILCRDLLGDFNKSVFEKIEETFNMALVIDGYLVTSIDENLEFNQEYFSTYEEYKGVYTNRLANIGSDKFLNYSDQSLEMLKTLILQMVQNLGTDYIVINKEENVILQNGFLEEYFESADDLIGKDILPLAKESVKYELEKGLSIAKEFKSANLERVPFIDEDDKPKMLNLNTIPLPDNNIVRDTVLIVFSKPSSSSGDRHTSRRPSVKFR